MPWGWIIWESEIYAKSLSDMEKKSSKPPGTACNATLANLREHHW